MLYLIINSSIEKKKKLEFFQKIVSHTHGPRPSEKIRKTKKKERRYRSQARSSFLPL